MNTEEKQTPERKVTPVKDYRGYLLGDITQEIQDITILNESRYSDKFAIIVWNKDFPRQYGISLEHGKKHADLITRAINNHEPMVTALESMLTALNTCGSGIPWNCDSSIENAYQLCRAALIAAKPIRE